MAERIFRNPNSGEPVVARLYAPHPVGASEWSCELEIQGLEAPFQKSVIGVDSFQALNSALCVLCAHLDKHAGSLTFEDGAPGDGVPMIVTWDYDHKLKPEVYQLIESKVRDSLAPS